MIIPLGMEVLAANKQEYSCMYRKQSGGLTADMPRGRSY